MPVATVSAEIDATVSFQTEQTDYGVAGSPTWDEIIDGTMEIDSLYMFGEDWTRAELVETFGKQGADALSRLIFNNIGEEWGYD
jgi:hypothetical protein